MPLVDKEKNNPGSSRKPAYKEEMNEILRKVRPEMKRPRPDADALASAMEAVQRLADEADAEDAAESLSQDSDVESASNVCSVCGNRNREQTKFCSMCGVALKASSKPGKAPEQSGLARHPGPFSPSEPLAPPRPTGNETHHYHHHYHHHYFQSGHEAMLPHAAGEPLREDKLRAPSAAMRGDMSRAEAAVRRVTLEWVLACNTKHLDDVLELYGADSIVLRSNYPPMRGAAAVREFFYGALDTGLGEVEMDPLRVDIVGDLAYEAGRFKALVPSTVGKRREERGKYLWVCQRQFGGEWKVVADCWASDLTLSTLESDVPLQAALKTSQPGKSS
jgi:ketosteroid isomerase-like protein